MDTRDLLIVGGIALLVYMFVLRKPAAASTQSGTAGTQKEAPQDLFSQLLADFGKLTGAVVSAAQTGAQKQ